MKYRHVSQITYTMDMKQSQTVTQCLKYEPTLPIYPSTQST